MVAGVFALIAGLIHIYIFVMESLLWGTPRINKVFAMTPDQAESNRLFAFNQGFYNLFLALGAIGGAILFLANASQMGYTIMLFSSACMLGASMSPLAFRRWRLTYVTARLYSALNCWHQHPRLSTRSRPAPEPCSCVGNPWLAPTSNRDNT